MAETKKEGTVPTGRTWKWAIGSALGAAIMAWIPNISGYIDAQTARLKAEAAHTKVVQQDLAAERDYELMRAAIEEHAIALEVLEGKFHRLERLCDDEDVKEDEPLAFPSHKRLPFSRPQVDEEAVRARAEELE